MLCPSVGLVDGRNLERCEVPPRLTVLVAYDVIGLFDIVMLASPLPYKSLKA